jgi:predicted GNAT family acetyltransferase
VEKSDYVEVNDQVAYHMVRPESVIELSVLDLVAQTTRNQPINKMVLNWNSAENKYEIVRRLPLVAMISPQFVRRRDDKMLNANDIRIQQVTDLVEVALADRDARQLNLPASTLIRREVMTKVLKGATMVRKLVMWQTNKESDSEHFPAFVIHYTDFSPNRKTPLEREIRVSSSRQQIDDLWTELATEAFTKGWAPAGAAGSAPPPPPATAVAAAPKKPAAKKKKTP